MIGTLTKIVSGAQTGADRGALDAALAAGLQIGGWAPSGWVYDVPGKPSVAVEYRPYMRMTSSQTTGMVARLNVQDSDATLLLSFAHELTGHEEFVLRQVKAQRKPCKHLVLPRGRGVVPAEVTSAVWEWLQAMRVSVLNVAGPRESKEPGIQAATKRVIAGLLNAKRDADTAASLALQDAEADATMATETAQAAEEQAESLRRMIGMGLRMRSACAECGSTVPCACAMKAYAAREIAAAKEAMDRKEREVYGSGKYREGGGPVQGLRLEPITQRVEFEAEDMLSRLYDKERERRSASTPPTPIPPEQLEWMDKAKAVVVESFYIPPGEPWQVVGVVPPSQFAGVRASTPQEFLPVEDAAQAALMNCEHECHRMASASAVKCPDCGWTTGGPPSRNEGGADA